MKNLLLVLGFTCLFSAGSNAQTNKEDLEIIQGMYGKSKKELIQAYMTIPETQQPAFWSEYDKYETERKKLGAQRAALIEDYANNYATLDDKKATQLMDTKLKWTLEYGKMQKKYFGSFGKIIGGVQASKLFQMEDYLENNVRLILQESIPFIDELDKSKLKTATQQ